ncbi:succinate dehydrogenase, cytochrome b556 subunit [uncultured Martelella sp.]|uniref:succinate dehydrogenase, cytochrome b556 subunit n=1 Tax=uncultured Martelella sp. TaxID=392331 RepID=UPI0029C7922D|nr:succinate dehydrogenase, cytochrome b556 subunit [uncultured Martelella sp.]
MANPTSNRPMSPHLQVYKFIPNYVMSGVHRITGAVMYFGTVLLAAWLIATAMGEGAFDCVNWFFGSWLGLFVLFGYTWSLVHHMLGGLRHFGWDMGYGLEKHFAIKVATALPFVSVCLTVLIWIVGLAV